MKYHIVTAITIALIATVFFVKMMNERPFGAASAGNSATVATTSVATVGTTATTLFATSTCSSRIITTEGSPIMLLFSDIRGSSTLSGSVGHWQAASTTEVYDSGLYGCSRVWAYSYAAQTVVLTETR
jgi:hypothetical protein